MNRIYSVAQARRSAKRMLPRVVFDYIDGGAEDEVTMRANEEAFDRVALRPRMASGVSSPDLAVGVLGASLSLPVILAPCGLTRVMHPEGAVAGARAAESRGTLSVLSAVAGSSIEEVAAESRGPMWYQLYAAGGRAEAGALIDRARDAGFGALVVTVDTPMTGKRERDLRHGVSVPLRLDARGAVRLAADVASKPVWVGGMLRAALDARRVRSSASVRDRLGAVGSVAADGSPFTWSDVEWFREHWQLPLVVKGILTGDDARRAVERGADGVVVSNHGGRQLEGAPATLRCLPEVVEAVGSEAEVLMDGGIRRGGDVVKALALGAKAVLIGRPYLYGLAYGGQRGVERVLDVLSEEMERTMTLMGCHAVAKLDSNWLQPEPGAAGVLPGSS
jgi:isopentenyl diphosphate isomerase/L-lactate dehydrogenase-like FMN-dependent dehydrogenase